MLVSSSYVVAVIWRYESSAKVRRAVPRRAVGRAWLLSFWRNLKREDAVGRGAPRGGTARQAQAAAAQEKVGDSAAAAEVAGLVVLAVEAVEEARSADSEGWDTRNLPGNSPR